MGSADTKVQAYNFRLCLTNSSANRAEIAQPSGYDPAHFELVRRFLRASPPQSIHQLIKLYAIANVSASDQQHGQAGSAGFKVDVNNVGPLSTDLIGGSWAYPEASTAERRRGRGGRSLETRAASRAFVFFFLTNSIRTTAYNTIPRINIQIILMGHGLCGAITGRGVRMGLELCICTHHRKNLAIC